MTAVDDVIGYQVLFDNRPKPPANVFVSHDAPDADPTIWLYDPDKPTQPTELLADYSIHTTGRTLLWTWLADTLPNADQLQVDCPVCQGGGEIGECANDGTHGCSHQYDKVWPCPACSETGKVTVGQILAPTWCSSCGLTGRCGDC